MMGWGIFGLRALVVSLFALGSAGAASAQLEKSFGVPVETAQARIGKVLPCDSSERKLGRWTCKSKFNFRNGAGYVPVVARVGYVTEKTNKVVSYYFQMNRHLTRQDYYPYFMQFVEFVDPEAAKTIHTTPALKDGFHQGDLVFAHKGILYEIKENSGDIKLEITKAKSDVLPKPFNYYAEPQCNRKENIRGWEASWGDKFAALEPSFQNIDPDNHVSGKFHLLEEGIHPAFVGMPNKSSYRHERYITIFVDEKPIYQGNWVTKREPTCCSSSVQPKMSEDMLKYMMQGKVGMVAISKDKEVKDLIAAANFDLTQLENAYLMAKRGRDIRKMSKEMGRCR